MLKKTLEINKYKNRDINDKYHEEYQYLNLLNDIMNEGSLEEGRNGFTKAVFGTAMHFSLENNKIPILTTKKTAWKTCLKELLWFVRGNNSDNNILRNQKVHIWDGNSTREYLDSINLNHFDENELGKIYGEQWRHFNQPYIPNVKKREMISQKIDYDENKGIKQLCDDLDNIYNFQQHNCNEEMELLKNNINNLKNKINFMSEIQPKQNIDQLQYIIDCLKDPLKRTSRRLVMSAWNPSQFDSMVLPPCHCFCQFYVKEGNKLSCLLLCRSQDEFIGTNFNISSYSFLTHLIAKHCNLIPYEFSIVGGNCHIYDDHFEQVEEQLKREPLEFPTLEILNKKENINDYDINDFKISNYKHHPQIKAKMRA